MPLPVRWPAFAVCAFAAGACAQVLGVDGDGYRPREGSGGSTGIDASVDTAGKSGGAGAGGNGGTDASAVVDASGGKGGAAGSGGLDASAGRAGTGSSGGQGGSGGISGSAGKGGAPGADASDGSTDAAEGGGSDASDSAVDGDSATSSDASDSGTADGDGAAGSDASDERDAADAGCSTGSAGTPGPSCTGLPATCGPNGNGDCCASSVVCGGTYNRSNDAAYPATVSDFRLDTYEITVGRFRKFVAAYTQNMIASGAGKNPNNPNDPGWDTAWNASLPADATALTASASGVQCAGAFQTWTSSAGVDENKPINCLTWFEAEAFCIWDGGRLPTEAEWNYAAAGGREQRVYPWGPTVPGADTKLAVYDCHYGNDAGACTSVSNIAPVGSSVAGNARWGQADLAGNLWEWAQDWSTSPYSAGSCDNCANLIPSAKRVVRGGSFNNGSQFLPSAYRDGDTPVHRGYDVGARCARTP